MFAIFLLTSGVSFPAVSAKRSNAKRKTTADADAPKAKAAGAAVLLALAQRQLDENNLQAASDYAIRAAKEAPELADYAHYIRAEAQARLGNRDEVPKAVAHVLSHLPVSPVTGPAAALAVQADLDNDKGKDALELIRKYYNRIPQPQADFLLARSFHSTGDLEQAAEYYQRVYYGYPKTKDASDAENFLNDLKTRLGDRYPPPMPAAMLGRAMKLIESKDYVGARNELNSVIPQLGGAQRDIASVRLGEVNFFNHDYAEARDYLQSLQVKEAEADAERLDYLIRSLLKLDKQANINPYLDTLAQKYPQSPYRLDILLTVGNQAAVDNDVPRYTEIFGACAASFPKNTEAAWCHWRLAFEHYRRDDPGINDELKRFIANFPASGEANAALYFLGRSAERQEDFASARPYYDAILEHHPNTYYALQAQSRLKDSRLRAAEPQVAALQYLKTVNWSARPQDPSFTPDREAQKRLTRSRLLHLAVLDDWAEMELRFASRNDNNSPYIFAYELAKIASDRNSPDQAVRYIKAFAPSYLQIGFDNAPARFWQLAFPLPFRAPLETYSRQNGVDPFFVAALIRQESEFNVKVISHAHAYGLMQVLPSTGRQLARQIGIRRFSASDLLTPNRNLQLGTRYVRQLLDSLNGHEEEALAAFNAGKSRVDRWDNWGPFREPAEFVETIPFQETRNYVQVVLRNAAAYRHIYANAPAAAAPPQTAPSPAKRRKTARKSPVT